MSIDDFYERLKLQDTRFHAYQDLSQTRKEDWISQQEWDPWAEFDAYRRLSQTRKEDWISQQDWEPWVEWEAYRCLTQTP